MYLVRHCLDQVVQECRWYLPIWFIMQLYICELWCPIDSNEQIKFTFFRAYFCNVDMEVADRIFFEFFLYRLIAFGIWQSADVMSWKAAYAYTNGFSFLHQNRRCRFLPPHLRIMNKWATSRYRLLIDSVAHAARTFRPSWLCCIARCTASVARSLPCSICPIILPSVGDYITQVHRETKHLTEV